MRRLPVIAAVVAAIVGLGLLSSIVSQGFRDLSRAESERGRLEAERQRLEERIESLQTSLEALSSDPEAVESLARKDLGWVRPGESVVLIATPVPAELPEPLTGETPTPILSLPD